MVCDRSAQIIFGSHRAPLQLRWACSSSERWHTSRDRKFRRGGRAVYGSGLENRQGASLRGFESHPLRQLLRSTLRLFSADLALTNLEMRTPFDRRGALRARVKSEALAIPPPPPASSFEFTNRWRWSLAPVSGDSNVRLVGRVTSEAPTPEPKRSFG